MVSWQAGLRDMVDVPTELGLWPVLAWGLIPGERVSTAIQAAAQAFAERNRIDAIFAFMCTIPDGAEEFIELGKVTLIQADWVPANFVVLARGGMQKINREYQHWTRVGIGAHTGDAL